MFPFRRSPKTSAAWYDKALDYYTARQYPKAIDALDTAILLDSKQSAIHYLRGLCLQNLERLDEARDAYEAALVQNSFDADVLYTLARLYYLQEDIDKAMEFARKADHAAGPGGDSQTSYLMGLLYEKQGDAEGATKAYIRSLNLNPDQPMAALFLAKLYIGAGRFAEASAMLGILLDTDPNNAEACYEFSLCQARQGQWEAALASSRRAVDLDPYNSRGFNQLGLALYCTNRFEEAIAAYEVALRLDPTYTTAWNNLAYTQERMNNLVKAIAAFERYRSLILDRLDEAQDIQTHIAMLQSRLGSQTVPSAGSI